MKKQFTLNKNERLKSRKQIEGLFSEGKKFSIVPFRVHYLFNKSADPPLLFGAGVSNKNFKKAIDRNRIKRIAKEAWRLQKKSLREKLKEQNRQLHIFLIYTGKILPEYKDVCTAMHKILEKLTVIIEPSA
jgi:ribonuclease P protein component